MPEQLLLVKGLTHNRQSCYDLTAIVRLLSNNAYIAAAEVKTLPLSAIITPDPNSSVLQ